MAVNTKTAVESRFVWFGALWVVVAVANFFGYADFEPNSNLNEIVTGLNGLAIIALRFRTNTGVTVR